MDKKSRKRNRRLMTLAIGLVAVCVAAFATRDDWSGLGNQRAIASEAEDRRHEAERKYAELTEERARLETPAGQEQQARKMGYRKPGEQPLTTR